MRKLLIATILSLPCWQTSNFGAIALAQSTGDVPAIITSGFDAYKEKGPEEAVKAWIKGSAVDGSKDALSQSNLLRQIQDYYGSYKSFDLIRARDLSQHTKVLYFSVNFDKGPLFAKFVAYKADSGWILVSFNFNTKEELILPGNSN